MLQTLFYIPAQVAGLPLVGWGLLAAVWAVGTLAWALWRARRHGFDAELRGQLPVLLVLGAVIVWVLPRMVEVDPASGAPLGIPIRGYGVLLLAGVVSGIALAVDRARAIGVDADTIYGLALWMFVAGIVGARAFFVIEYAGEFQRPSVAEWLVAVIDMTKGGLVVYGSLIGAAAAFGVYVARRRLPLWALADAIAPSLVLGLALGRVGCFLNGCCFGGACELPWAVTFPPGSPPYLRELETGRLLGLQWDAAPTDNATGGATPTTALPGVGVRSVVPEGPAARAGLMAGQRIVAVEGAAVRTVAELRERLLGWYVDGARQPGGRPAALRLQTDRGPVEIPWGPAAPPRSGPLHPTQLYSALDAAITCVLLLAWTPLRRRDGELTALLFTIHPVSRFLLEQIRVDEESFLGTGLSISQNLSLLLLAGGVGLWVWLRSQPPGVLRVAGPEPPRAG